MIRLQEKDLNPRPRGYGPRELPLLYPARLPSEDGFS